MLHREHLAGAAHARLHFVGNQQDAVLFAQRPQIAVKLGRRNDVAPLALNWLDDDRGDLLRGDGALEKVLQLIERIETNVAITIRIIDVAYQRNQRRKSASL